MVAETPAMRRTRRRSEEARAGTPPAALNTRITMINASRGR